MWLLYTLLVLFVLALGMLSYAIFIRMLGGDS
jgi:hypothetical protein